MTESFSLAKGVHNEIREVVFDYKVKRVMNRGALIALQKKVDYAIACIEMRGTKELYEQSMDAIMEFASKFRDIPENSIEEKIYIKKLERLDDDLNRILDAYSRKWS